MTAHTTVAVLVSKWSPFLGPPNTRKGQQVMRMDPMHAVGGFTYHISTECPDWKAMSLARRIEGTGNKQVCARCIRLLQSGKG